MVVCVLILYHKSNHQRLHFFIDNRFFMPYVVGTKGMEKELNNRVLALAQSNFIELQLPDLNWWLFPFDERLN